MMEGKSSKLEQNLQELKDKLRWSDSHDEGIILENIKKYFDIHGVEGLNYRDDVGSTLLHYVAAFDSVTLLEFLLTLSDAVEYIRNDSGNDPLLFALGGGAYNCCLKMLEEEFKFSKDIDVLYKNKFNQSIHLEVMKLATAEKQRSEEEEDEDEDDISITKLIEATYIHHSAAALDEQCTEKDDGEPKSIE